MMVIVPNHLSDLIYEKVDAQIALHPDASPDRDYYYRILLAHFNDHGYVPDFTLQKRSDGDRSADGK